jgi:hypothetical protein
MEESNESGAMTRRAFLIPVLLAAATCSRGTVAPDAGASWVAEPPALTLTRYRTDLLFTWIDLEGKLHDVDSARKVPEDRRKQVLVRDLSKRPEERIRSTDRVAEEQRVGR